MQLVLLTFGDRLDNHLQAAFSIVSFLKADPKLEVRVVTDRPLMYRHFAGRVELLTIDDSVLREWRQPFDFFWRIKIRALQEAAAAAPGRDMLYVDSDTILVEGLDRLAARLACGQAVMHLPEQRLSVGVSSTERQMWRSLHGRRFAGVAVDADTTMWNAGVIGLPGARAAATLALALQLCDELCATDARRRLLEQLALSMALQAQGPLVDARREVLHYWGNKPGWQQAISYFWLQSRLQGHTLDHDIAAFDARQHVARPLASRPSAWARWLLRRVAAQAPTRLEYFGE